LLGEDTLTPVIWMERGSYASWLVRGEGDTKSSTGKFSSKAAVN